MRGRATVTLVTVLAALAAASAACGDDGGGGRGDPDRVEFSERAEEVVEDWPDVRPLEGRDTDVLPVQGIEQDGGDEPRAERRLTLDVEHGACVAQYGGWVHEAPDMVVVSGWVRHRDDGVECPDPPQSDPVQVELDRDLGDRTVVDAATGRQLSVA